MKTWAEMTERERDVLICQTLGYIPVRDNWWMNPNVDFDCEPFEAFEWLEEHHSGDMWGVEYKGSDVRFKGKKFIKALHASRFSTDRAAAMTLLDGDDVESWAMGRLGREQHSVTIILKGQSARSSFEHTLPHAICLAFLRAKGVEIE